MAENVIIECPPTPDNIAAIPATPPSSNSRIREFLKSQQLPDGNNSDEERQRELAGSPPNCAICLGKINSKCFTDSCMHQFCFSCLLQWSKIKAECPLCKQTFKSIIHNVISMDTYEEYKVQPYVRCTNWANIADQFEQFILASTFPRYRSRATVGENHNQSRIFQLFLNESVLTERFAREYSNDVIPSRSNGSLWRAYIYQRGLYAIPLLDFNGGGRDISARFYRNNPAQVHRLMPWLNREILWLLDSPMQYITCVLRIIQDLIITHDMTSVSFRRRIQSYFRRYTSHFLHELINFARSPYDLHGYDRSVQYRPFYEEEVENIESSEDSLLLSSNDSDSSNTEPRFSIETRINNTSVIVFGSFGEPSNVNPNSQALAQNNIPAITQSLPTAGNIESVSIESDESDECQFVGEQKPPHLRTPELVELNSETDSDVMFVEEVLPRSQPSDTVVNRGTLGKCDGNCMFAQKKHGNDSSSKRKRKMERFSSEDSSDSKKFTKTKRFNESKRDINHTHTSSSTIVSSGKVESTDACPYATTLTKDGDVNNGASTSQPFVKNYAKPIRRHAHSTNKTKGIYDSSSSSSDSDSSDNSESSHEVFTVSKGYIPKTNKKKKREIKKRCRKTVHKKKKKEYQLKYMHYYYSSSTETSIDSSNSTNSSDDDDDDDDDDD